VAAGLVFWLVTVVVLAVRGVFFVPAGGLPLPIVAAVMAPLAVFGIGFAASRGFRQFLAAVDLQLITALQAWRVAGFAFIALYAHGILPGLFAWPAGLGDMAVGAVAPWMVMSLVRRPNYAASRSFRTWNLLGILDLVVALATGALGTALATGAAGEVTTSPMGQLPLVLVPAYLVPIFLLLHLTALYQARRAS
jgi:hypothetical protein